MELAPGNLIQGTSYVLGDALAEDAWGRLWRARDDQGKEVFAVTYETEAGAALFREALPALKRWREVATPSACPEHLPIVQIEEHGPIPFVLVKDPGGTTLREFSGGKPMDPSGAAKAMTAISGALLRGTSYDIHVHNITPDSIIAVPGDQSTPWRLLPIAPGVKKHADQVWNGRYAPPELARTDDINKLKPDMYALSWMLADLIAGDFSLPRDQSRLKEHLPYPRLRTLLGNGMRPRDGSYGDPKLTEMGLKHWVAADAQDDLAEARRAMQEAQGGGPAKLKHSIKDNQKIITQAAALLLIVILILAGIFIVPGMLRAKNTVNTPYGLSNLFIEALVERDADKARQYTTGEATGVVETMLREIQAMEDQNQASRFAEGVPVVAGAGNARTVKVDLKGENGDLFMIAEMTIQREDGNEWKVEKLFYKSTREN